MILPIARVLLLSTILGGFAVSTSFAQGTQGGQGPGRSGPGRSDRGYARRWRCRWRGRSFHPQATPPSGASKQSDKKQHNMQDQQGQSGGQAMDHKKHRGEGEQAGRRDGGRGEMDMRRGRHEGRHRRDARFRYYHGGFWYADPWWTVVVGNDRHVSGAGGTIPTIGRAATPTSPPWAASRLRESVRLTIAGGRGDPSAVARMPR